MFNVALRRKCLSTPDLQENLMWILK